MENRTFTRVDFSGRASINYGDKLLWGNINNLSLQGLFINTPHDLPLNLPLEVTIHHYPNPLIQLHACAVHYEKTGVGMKIHKLDAKSFVRLREAILLKCQDETLLMNETLKVLHSIN